MSKGGLHLLGQILMLTGLAVPLCGIALALTAGGDDFNIIGLEILALTVGYLVFLAGRWLAAKGQET